ncbi:unnamed protein product, partial [Mycena citricolor]
PDRTDRCAKQSQLSPSLYARTHCSILSINAARQKHPLSACRNLPRSPPCFEITEKHASKTGSTDPRRDAFMGTHWRRPYLLDHKKNGLALP